MRIEQVRQSLYYNYVSVPKTLWLWVEGISEIMKFLQKLWIHLIHAQYKMWIKHEVWKRYLEEG